MIAKMKIVEVNIVNNITNLANTSLAKKQLDLEEELGKLKEELTKNNEVVLNKLLFYKNERGKERNEGKSSSQSGIQQTTPRRAYTSSHIIARTNGELPGLMG